MAKARMRHDWNQTADILALTANVNRSERQRAFKRSQFHPMEIEEVRSGVRLTAEVLRAQRKFFAK